MVWMGAVTMDFNPLPRKEGDDRIGSGTVGGSDFNPLPRKEGDGRGKLNMMQYKVFQSTPS